MIFRDRRAYPRKRVSLILEGRTNNGTISPASGGRLRLETEDLSLGGMSAMVHEPVVGGARIAIFFPPQHPCTGALASGRVIRCERRNNSYRIGVEFDRFPSARGRLPYPSAALSDVVSD